MDFGQRQMQLLSWSAKYQRKLQACEVCGVLWGVKHKLKKKIELAYMVANENLLFKKMNPLRLLEEKHGVELGATTRMIWAVPCVLKPLLHIHKRNWKNKINNAKFFSHCCWIVPQIVAMLKKNCFHWSIQQCWGWHSACQRSFFFAVHHLVCATGEGLYGFVKKSLTYMGGVRW